MLLVRQWKEDDDYTGGEAWCQTHSLDTKGTKTQ